MWQVPNHVNYNFGYAKTSVKVQAAVGCMCVCPRDHRDYLIAELMIMSGTRD